MRAFGLAWIFGVWVGVATAFGDVMLCDATQVIVEFESKEDAELACEAAKHAIDFMSKHDFHTHAPVEIHMRSQLRLPDSGEIVGLYRRDGERIDILSFSACERQLAHNSIFGITLDRALYRSFIVHEVAHIIIDRTYRRAPPSLLVHEMIAYVVQFETMDAELREKILSESRIPAYDDLSQVSLLYYQLNPQQFGIKIYRHFRHSQDLSADLHELMSSELNRGREFH